MNLFYQKLIREFIPVNSKIEDHFNDINKAFVRIFRIKIVRYIPDIYFYVYCY